MTIIATSYATHDAAQTAGQEHTRLERLPTAYNAADAAHRMDCSISTIRRHTRGMGGYILIVSEDSQRPCCIWSR